MPNVAGTARILLIPSLENFQREVKAKLAGIHETLKIPLEPEVDQAAAAKAEAEMKALSERLAKSRDAEIAAAGRVRAAEQQVETARDRSNAAAQRITRSEERLTQTRRAAEAAEQDVRRAEDGLSAAKQQGTIEAANVRAAEQALTDVRNRSGASTHEISAAERDLSAARASETAVQRDIQRLETALTDARNRARSGIADVHSAEQQLRLARISGSQEAAAISQAEQRLNTARQNLAAAGQRAVDGENDLRTARIRAQAASDAVRATERDLDAVRRTSGASSSEAAAAETRLGAARRAAEVASAESRRAENALQDARRAAEGEAVNVRNAEQAVSDARDGTNTRTRTVIAAETQLRDARQDLQRAQHEVRTTEDDLTDARGRSEAATRQLSETTNQHREAQHRSTESTREGTSSTRESTGAHERHRGTLGQLVADIKGLATSTHAASSETDRHSGVLNLAGIAMRSVGAIGEALGGVVLRVTGGVSSLTEGFSVMGLTGKTGWTAVAGAALEALKMIVLVWSALLLVNLAIGGLGALASAFVAAAGAAGIFGLAAGGVISDLIDKSGKLEQAQKAVTEATTPKERETALKKVRDLQADWNDSTREGVRVINDIKGAWKGFLDGARPEIVRVLAASVDAIKNGLNAMQPIIKPVADVFIGWLTGMNRSLQAGALKRFFDWIARDGAPMLKRIGDIFGQVFAGMTDLLIAFAPYGTDLLKWVLDISTQFANWAKDLKSNPEFQKWMDEVKKAAPSIIALIGALIKFLWDLSMTALHVYNVVHDTWEKVGPFFKVLWDVVTGIFSTVIDYFVNIFLGPIVRIVTTIIDNWTGITGFFGWLWETVKGIFSGALNWITGAVPAAWKWVSDQTAAAWKWVSDTVRDAWNSITSTISGAMQWAGDRIRDGWNTISDTITGAMQWIGDRIRDGWNSITGTIGGALQWISDHVREAWDWVSSKITGVMQWISDRIRDGWNAIISAIGAALQWISDRVRDAWDWISNKIRDAMDAISNKIRESWEWISNKIRELHDAISNKIREAWDWISGKIRDIHDAIANKVREAWEWISNKIREIHDAISNKVREAWDWISNKIREIHDAIANKIREAWDWINNKIREIHDAISNKIRESWDWISNKIKTIHDDVMGIVRAGWDWIQKKIEDVTNTISDTIHKCMETAKRWFNEGTGWIQTEWEKLRGITAKPVNFVINTVWNNGIKKAWDAVAKLVSLPEMPKVDAIPEMATGGLIPGTGNRDTVPAMLMPGEYVLSKRAVQFFGLHNVDEAHKRGRERRPVEGMFLEDTPPGAANLPRFASGGLVGPVQHFATGGQVEALNRGIEFAKSMHGTPYILGGGDRGGTDCSGFMAMIKRAILDQQPWDRREWATETGMPPPGFTPGLSAGFSIGVHHGGEAGGHTAGTVGGMAAYGIPAINVESGSGHGGEVGNNVMGAANSYFPEKYHLIGFEGPFEGVPGEGGGGGGLDPAALAHAAKHAITDPFRGLIGAGLDAIMPGPETDNPPNWKKGAKAYAFKLYDAIVDWLDRKIDEFFGGSGGGLHLSSNAQGAVNIGRDMAAQIGWTGAQWDALLELWTRESGWDVNAVNSSSGAYGIPQALGHGHPYNLGDAVGQINWGLGYIRDRYGDPISALNFHHAHNWYDDGGWLPPGMSTVFNGTGRPEAVFSARQWETLSRHLENGGSGSVTVNTYMNASPEHIDAVVDRRVSLAARL